MVTPASTAAVPSAKSAAPRSLRALILWVVVAATLVSGLVFALRFGAGVPALLEGGL